jgi:hypothetical protein
MNKPTLIFCIVVALVAAWYCNKILTLERNVYKLGIEIQELRIIIDGGPLPIAMDNSDLIFRASL